MTIEETWQALRTVGVASQRRVDATHPCDLYADFEPPDQFGLVAVCGRPPPESRPMRSIAVTHGQRADGRWSLRVALLDPALLTVFAALCRDIIAATAQGVDEAGLAAAVISRVQRWRSLLERGAAGLNDQELRGLIGELVVLEARLMDVHPLRVAVDAWQGPDGAPQDFLLPIGERIEVKAADRDASGVHINGLMQLDGGPDRLTLAVVRLLPTGAAAAGSMTVPRLIRRVRDRLVDDADALFRFDASLASAGWHEHPSHDELAFRILHIDAYEVGIDFPKLTVNSVPAGVDEVTYRIELPPEPDETWAVEP